MRRRDRQSFRTCLVQTPQRPFISTCRFAICILRPAFLPLPAPLQSIPSQPQQPPPRLCFVNPAAFSARASLTRCATSWGGPRGARWEDSGRLELPQRPGRGGVRPLQLVHHLQAGAINLLFLPPAPGGVRPSAPAPHSPLHPPRGHLRPPHGDVRGGSVLASPSSGISML
jgi:hypothetical protein